MAKIESYSCPNIYREDNNRWCQVKLGIGTVNQRCGREYPECPFLKSGNVVDNTANKRGLGLRNLLDRLRRGR